MGYTNLVTFVDDGVSGVTMDRPGFNAMMDELEKGHAAAVFVKDMSRLGRNYIEVGRLMEEFFPEHDIRLVAVSDGIDTFDGDNELTPIKICSTKLTSTMLNELCLDAELEYCRSTLYHVVFIVLQMHQKRNITGENNRRIGREEKRYPCKDETFRLIAHSEGLEMCAFLLFG